MEVLKAIQKAKEVKSKLGQPEKKVGLYGGVVVRSSQGRSWLQWNWALGILRATES